MKYFLNVAKSIAYRLIKIYWVVAHTRGCPDKYLTSPDAVQYCHKCGRLRYRDKQVEEVFNRINNVNK